MPKGMHGNHPTASRQHRWKPGSRVGSTGHVKVRVGVGHPLADPNGWAYEHIVVWVSAGNRRPQRGEILHHINDAKPDLSLIPLCTLEDEARVWMYGREKYAAWNWAKGMPWSVPYACALRHLAAWHRGETLDPESGLPHLAHVMCNLRMLTLYAQTYPEGDDRPVQWMPEANPASQVLDGINAAVKNAFKGARAVRVWCSKCGDLLCPHATDPSRACTGSNDVGQAAPAGRLNYGQPAPATSAAIDASWPAFDAWYATQSHQLSNEQVCRTIWRAAWRAAKADGAWT